MPEQWWQTVGLKQFMAVNVCTKPILQFSMELALAKYLIISSLLILPLLWVNDRKTAPLS